MWPTGLGPRSSVLVPEEIASGTAAMSFQVPRRCWRVGSLDMSQALTRRRDGAKCVVARGEAASRMYASASAMRDRIDQPESRQAQQADKDQGNGVYDHAMPIIILAFRAFVFREVGNR